MLKKLFLVFLVLLIAGLHASNAQSALLSDAGITFTTESPGSISGTFEISVTDTTSISQFELVLGSNENESDLVSSIIDFDAGTLPNDFHYTRNKFKILISSNSFDAQSTYFGKVRIKDSSGNWQDPVLFVAN